jgi:hypothetical protein
MFGASRDEFLLHQSPQNYGRRSIRLRLKPNRIRQLRMLRKEFVALPNDDYTS